MTITKETDDRLSLLEELLQIPGAFGFSIPRMTVIEKLTHVGKDYIFYYDERKASFLIISYNQYQKVISKVGTAENCIHEFEKVGERWEKVKQGLEQRILEKNQAIPSPHNEEYEGFLTKAVELTNATKHLAEELAVLENKEEVKQALHSIEEQIHSIQTKIEEQKERNLQNVLAHIHNETKKEGVV